MRAADLQDAHNVAQMFLGAAFAVGLHLLEDDVLGPSVTALTALHELQHAISSYSNGSIVDLYVDSPPGVNCKRGRPIPPDFANYNGAVLASDPIRDGLGYDPGWSSYHCGLIDPSLPAVMDNYFLGSTPDAGQNDEITRRFILDRLNAKLSR